MAQRTRPKFGPCAICGEPMHISQTSRPIGQAAHRHCKTGGRRYDPRNSMTPCIDCGVNSWGQRCRACADAANVCARPMIRSVDDPAVKRRRREQRAPGLSAHSRSLLLSVWRRQGRRCTYCDELADTVDHVVPLVRGGTNHEGNLAPCCRRCNASKGGYLIVEWRYGLRLSPMDSPLPWRTQSPPRVKQPRGTQTSITFCVCGEALVGRQWCSPRCYMRVRYRRQVGIPDNAPKYSRAS